MGTYNYVILRLSQIQFIIPPSAFLTFDQLRSSGQITAFPAVDPLDE